MLPIPNDVAANRSGRGMMGVVDDGCTCFVTIDGGYEMSDFESNRSDDVLMSAIVTIMMMRVEGEESMWVNVCLNERVGCQRVEVEMMSGIKKKEERKTSYKNLNLNRSRKLE
jgi:hypothetical protein